MTTAEKGVQLTQPVRTSEGAVRGFVEHGVSRFLGIPYAAPPTGELRWRPPQAPATRQQLLQALAYGPTCAQINTVGVFAAPSDSEDCLYLNVFAPETTQEQGSRSPSRPVMVWIHGGGNMSGESNDYDGGKLAREGGTVVVTINYRLNIFGFFAHPALDAEGHPAANYGIMDQQFALQWVKRNIRAFGGDPDNVTIFGESAGGANVLALMASPASARLFHRGIIQSGAFITAMEDVSLADAEEIGQRFATAAGCVDQSSESLRALPVDEILAKSGTFLCGPGGIIVDGTIIPQPLATAFAAGNFQRVPVINGSTRDEFRFFIPIPDVGGGEVAPGTYEDRVRAMFGPYADAVLARYPLEDFDSPNEAVAAAVGDQMQVSVARRLNRTLSKFVPVFAFEFADRTAPSYAPLPSFPYGAAHTFELMYLFPLYRGGLGTPHPLNDAQERLSDQMVSYWTKFAERGNPNSPHTPYWPQYNATLDNYQSLNLPDPVTITSFAADHNCEFWDELH
ncbi:MAG: para-nitrobenzyl esterase [Ilumatobacteraceae bacterium]|jgi:para-nitrobenzyl esterase